MNCKFALLLAALFPSPVLAASFADLAAIDHEVAAFTGAPQGASGGAALPVDRRLRLTQCSGPLALSWYGTRHETVLVECPITGGWKLFVPLLVTSSVASALAVMRGETVAIIISGDGFTVSQSGEAMESGAPGAWIKVRKAGANAEPLRAQVLRSGVVGISLP